MALTLILASGSPRRKQMLEVLPWDVEIRPTDVDESQEQVESAANLVRRLAALKALTAYSRLAPGEKPSKPGLCLIIGADTVVVHRGQILGKPSDEAQALEYLRELRQGSHEVHSGICIVDAGTGKTVAESHSTRLLMRDYSEEEIEKYIKKGQPLDKAGAYSLQDPDFRPIRKLDGCAASVMGFPMGIFSDMCQENFNCDLPTDFSRSCAAITGWECCREEPISHM